MKILKLQHDKRFPFFGYVRLSLTTLLLLTSCEDKSEPCTEQQVYDCYADVGCPSGETCTLEFDGMNQLCKCLAKIECNQEWYHAYCDDAPYSNDTDCPICGR